MRVRCPSCDVEVEILSELADAYDAVECLLCGEPIPLPNAPSSTDPQRVYRAGPASLRYMPAPERVEWLTRRGHTKREALEFLEQEYRVQAIDLTNYEISDDVVKLVSRELCEKHRVIPIKRAGSSLIVAMADPSNSLALDDIKFMTGYNVEPVIASDTAIQKAIDQHFGSAV